MPTRGHGAPPTDQRLKAGEKARSLYGQTLFAPLRELLVKRFRGEDALLKLCDAALVDSVRAAPR